MQIRLSLITLLAVCVLSGCDGEKRPAGFPPIFPCEITITQGGKPLEGALVRLMPEGTSSWVIGGNTNASGTATIRTDKYAGVPAGTFKVTVSKIYETPTQIQKPAETGTTFAEWEAWRAAMDAEKRPRYKHVKEEFENVDQTPLSITITKGKNKETFDLGEAVEILLD